MGGYLEQFREQGYAVVKGVFSGEEVAGLRDAFDRIRAQGERFGASFRHGNVLFAFGRDPALGPVLRMAQWPAYFDAALDAMRVDLRLFEIVRPLLGDDVKQIINQLHWKPPGAAQAEFGYHQDIRFRRPREAYRNPERSYVQTGIAVDPHFDGNGAMTLLPGSHRAGEIAFPAGGRVMDTAKSDDALVQAGLDPARGVDLALDPGDVALWGLFMVHGSGPNRSGVDRRFYLNGYVRAEDCDRGEWAWRGGRPCPLGAPALVHYERLRERPEPHYVETA
jgi:ectoine hydroxylase-related dioxygenase (phytanoyl-CoA dioxygenase family)